MSNIDDLLATHQVKSSTEEYTISNIGAMLKEFISTFNKLAANDFIKGEEYEKESLETEMMEYKNDFYEMSVGSIRAIMEHASKILENLENPQVKNNLTESWLQGKIAITEDYMRTIHDFIIYVEESESSSDAASKPGLWENIRKKREKMGKNYKPAKPGDKDRPDTKTWKKLTKE
jgi:hypothetical protein